MERKCTECSSPITGLDRPQDPPGSPLLCDGCAGYPSDVSGDFALWRSLVYPAAAFLGACVALALLAGVVLLSGRSGVETVQGLAPTRPVAPATTLTQSPLIPTPQPPPIPGVAWGVDGYLVPQPGYVWDTDGSHEGPRTFTGRHVMWLVGTNHPSIRGIISGVKPGSWQPAIGYDWANPGSSDLKTRWVTGMSYPGQPHVLADATEGNWRPEAGYNWISPGAGEAEVRWTPGIVHPEHPHLFSGREVGSWEPEAGYNTTMSGDRRLVWWSSGIRHPSVAHIAASKEEGKWVAIDGYRFATNHEGDLRVLGPPDGPSISAANVEGALKFAALVGAALVIGKALNEIAQGGDEGGGPSYGTTRQTCGYCYGSGQIQSRAPGDSSSGPAFGQIRACRYCRGAR